MTQKLLYLGDLFHISCYIGAEYDSEDLYVFRMRTHSPPPVPELGELDKQVLLAVKGEGMVQPTSPVPLCGSGSAQHTPLCGSGSAQHTPLCGSGSAQHTPLCGSGLARHFLTPSPSGSSVQTPLRGKVIGKGGSVPSRPYLKNLKVVDRKEVVAESRARAQIANVAVRKDTLLEHGKILEHLFNGPTETAAKVLNSRPKASSNNPPAEPTTPKSSCIPKKRRVLHPQTNKTATNVKMKVTVNQLEDLLCSPSKSTLHKVEVNRSRRKPASPMKHPSPMKSALFSPSHPKPTSTSSLLTADVSQFQAARAALHTGTPKALLCREKEVGAMSTWLDEHLVAGKPGSIYVSGGPGTGKTATIVSLLAGKVAKYRYIIINCMVLKSSIAIYREVASKLCPGGNPKTEKAAMKIIEEELTSSKEMVLLVLDEVDQLESRDQTVLYTVFEWPALQGSKLALVGIANSLDLTARVLPRLQFKEAYKPSLLHYPPYTKQQLIFIITSRLQEGAGTGWTAVITPQAIALLASKISALSGDLRKALDVCRRALELAESVVRKQTLLKPMKSTGLANPAVSPGKGYTSPKAMSKIGQVDLPHIMKVVNQVYGSPVTASLGRKGEGLPVQQKILVASLLLMVKRGRTKEVTLGKLIDTYNKVLKKRNMQPELESSCVGVYFKLLFCNVGQAQFLYFLSQA